MKLYLSVDMEGISGVTAWEDVRKGTSDHAYFRQQMSNEVTAICQRALQSGFSEVLVKDAHASARNILMDNLPRGVRLFSGWGRDPLVMMSGLDSTFAAAIFAGYHAGAYFDGNPLAHTMSSDRIMFFKINGKYASEFVLNAYTAAYFKVPVIAITGDERVCAQARDYIPAITTIPVKRGWGNGVITVGKSEALELIENGIATAAAGDFCNCVLDLPAQFNCEICFKDHALAYRASFFPGVKLLDCHTIGFETEDYYEVLRTYFFI